VIRMLDKADFSILECLKSGSRDTIRNIAKKTRLRPSTVHQRMRSLESDGTIRNYTVNLDRKKIGLGFVAFLLIETKSRIPDSILENPHVAEVYGITGEYDLLIKLQFADIGGFNAFLLKLRENRSIRKTMTMVATVAVKE
jgi:DNA-binding Lrp family transcriptional regulator